MASSTSPSTNTLGNAPQPVVSSARQLWLNGGIALIAAVIVNLLIRTIVAAIAATPGAFTPFTPGIIVMWTIIGVLGATIVRVLLKKQSPTFFRNIALGVLVVSLIPDVLVFTSGAFPGTNLASVGALVAMHLATGALCVWFLTRPVRAR